MIRLHYANRLENLIAPLADAVAAQQRARPLDRVTIVVPGRVIEHYLKHRVSEAIGIAANLEFPFLRRFLAKVIEEIASLASEPLLQKEQLPGAMVRLGFQNGPTSGIKGLVVVS